MISQETFQEELNRIITNGIREDVGGGDCSSMACIPKTSHGKARLLVKEDGIIAGVEFAKMIFQYVDNDLRIKSFIEDGEQVKKGDIIFEVEGSCQSILKGERLVLNAMQRMSAIATKTALFVSLIEGTFAKLLDTRKTTPGIRALEKWAVKIGGGENHRFGLYDMIMLKDNHVDFAGGISNAIEKTKQFIEDNKLDLKIVVEARTLEEVRAILQTEGVHRVLLDNFSFTDTSQAVEIVNKKIQTESSGNINEQNIRKYADCGVDFISCGALTHSVCNMDMSLNASF